MNEIAKAKNEVLSTKTKNIIIIELLIIILLLSANFVYYSKADQARLETFKLALEDKNQQIEAALTRADKAENKLAKVHRALDVSLDTYNQKVAKKAAEAATKK